MILGRQDQIRDGLIKVDGVTCHVPHRLLASQLLQSITPRGHGRIEDHIEDIILEFWLDHSLHDGPQTLLNNIEYLDDQFVDDVRPRSRPAVE